MLIYVLIRRVFYLSDLNNLGNKLERFKESGNICPSTTLLVLIDVLHDDMCMITPFAAFEQRFPTLK